MLAQLKIKTLLIELMTNWAVTAINSRTSTPSLPPFPQPHIILLETQSRVTMAKHCNPSLLPFKILRSLLPFLSPEILSKLWSLFKVPCNTSTNTFNWPHRPLQERWRKSDKMSHHFLKTWTGCVNVSIHNHYDWVTNRGMYKGAGLEKLNVPLSWFHQTKSSFNQCGCWDLNNMTYDMIWF